jgi:outer membrane receptor protein involved in Fe transport
MALRIWLVGLAMAAAPGAALAQSDTAPPPPANPAVQPSKPAAAKPQPARPKTASPRTVQGLTVTGGAADIQSSIDRRSFTFGKDLQATTGSIADALRNVPSVEVDLQGNLSLRGDSNVTILVDGKPAPQFEGAGRADALQQLSADQFERVEVITNPSAALNPEGSGGVINLISKKSRGAGVTGSLNATLGSAGLKREGVSFGYNSARLSVTASLSGNYQRNKLSGTDLREVLDSASGKFLPNNSDFIGRNLTRGPTGHVNLSYNLDAKDQLTASAQLNQLLIQGHPFNHFDEEDAAGDLVFLQNRQGSRRFEEKDVGLTGGWKHSFAGDGHDLSVDLVYNETVPVDHTLWQTFQAEPPTGFDFERIFDDADQQHAELRLAYSRPMPGGGSLKAGYELKHDRDEFDYQDFRGDDPASLLPDLPLANHFLYKQTINDIYATYEKPFGDLDVQLGLRLEDVQLDLFQLTSGEVDHPGYDKAYPTLHLAYKLDDERKLTASFSERVNRPPSVLLNPLRYIIDPQDVQQGNPNLKPQISQVYELGYERKSGGSDDIATLFYRRYQGEFAQVLVDLGNGVFESTFDNLGSSQSAGLELVASGKLTSKLSYNVSTDLFWREIDAANLGFAGSRSGFGASGRASLDWQARADDLLQFNVVARGPRLEPQGVDQPNWNLNLGWRHRFGDRITATLTAQDILATNRYARKFDTATLIERFRFTPRSRAVFVRLDYRFGGKSAKGPQEPAFEYENQAPPGPM